MSMPTWCCHTPPRRRTGKAGCLLQAAVPKPVRRPAKNLQKMIQNLNASMLKLQEKITILDQATGRPFDLSGGPQKAADYAKSAQQAGR